MSESETKKRGRPPKVESVEVAHEPQPIVQKPQREPMNTHVEFIAHYENQKRLGRRPVFANKDFKGLKLRGHNLPAADFINCSFDGAEFVACTFQGWLASGCDGQPILENTDVRFGNYITG